MYELVPHHSLASLIDTYGYWIVFLFTLLEGEMVVAAAGFAAHQGYLKLEYVILVATLGATIGDQLFFLFGKWKGREYLHRRPQFSQKVERVRALLERYQNLFIFGSRFMYGFRMIIPVALGTTRVSFRRFFVFNLLGAIVWAVLFANLGYIFGDALEVILGKVKRFEQLILVLIVLGGFIVVRAYIYAKEKRTAEGGETQSKVPQ